MLRRLSLGGGLVLRPHKLRIVDEAVLVVIVRSEDGIDQRGQFIVGEDFVLVAGLAGLLLIFAFLVPMDQRFDQLAPIQLVVVVGVVHLEVVELQFLFTHFARIDRDVHVLSNVRLFLLEVVCIQHLLRLTMVGSMATAVGLLLLLVLLLLLMYRRLLILGLNRNLLLLVLRRLLLLLMLLLLLIVLLLLRGWRGLIVLWRGWLILLLRLLLIMTGIDSGRYSLTECHRCKQRQG